MGEFLFYSRGCKPSAFATFAVAPCKLHAAGKTKFPPIGREAQRSDPGGRAQLPAQYGTEPYVTPDPVLFAQQKVDRKFVVAKHFWRQSAQC